MPHGVRRKAWMRFEDVRRDLNHAYAASIRLQKAVTSVDAVLTPRQAE